MLYITFLQFIYFITESFVLYILTPYLLVNLLYLNKFAQKEGI